MAEAVANPAELQMSRELAREKLQALKAGRRSRAEIDYGAGRAEVQAVGRDIAQNVDGQSIPEQIEQNPRLEGFRGNVGARAERFGQIQALRAARKGNQSNQQVQQNAEAGASAFAKQAYTRAWQWAEEGVQDFAFTFADLMLLSGPAAVAIFLVRLIGGNMMGGSGTVNFREVTVPRVPGYSVPEGVYKFTKVAAIGLITGLLYAVIILLIGIITDPGLLVKIGLCSVFSGVLSFFGNTSCTAT